jgi:Na+-translocating ferredoxin:NAD+ oxidoreductase RnfD subunit
MTSLSDVEPVGEPSRSVVPPSLTFRPPSLSDPRLHLASVVITIQVLGQTVFGFDLSIAQILLTVGTCAAIESMVNLTRQRLVAWPASAMLTGNGVALILRVPGTEHGDWWSLHGWWVFVGIGTFSIVSKYVVRWNGSPLFNPSNLGIVVGVIVFRNVPIDRLNRLEVDLQDLWWGPVSNGMVAAFVVIGAGALFITRRLNLLGMALSFWATFAAGTALLAVLGKCIHARWHLGPICGWELWWILVTSPEVLIFLAFMITDPKTTPSAPRRRLVFGAGIGALSAVLVALFETELPRQPGRFRRRCRPRVRRIARRHLDHLGRRTAAGRRRCSPVVDLRCRRAPGDRRRER